MSTRETPQGAQCSGTGMSAEGSEDGRADVTLSWESELEQFHTRRHRAPLSRRLIQLHREGQNKKQKKANEMPDCCAGDAFMDLELL